MKKEKSFRDETIDKFYSLPESIRKVIVSNFLYANFNFISSGQLLIDKDDFYTLCAFEKGVIIPKNDFKLSTIMENTFIEFLYEKDVFNKQK